MVVNFARPDRLLRKEYCRACECCTRTPQRCGICQRLRRRKHVVVPLPAPLLDDNEPEQTRHRVASPASPVPRTGTCRARPCPVAGGHRRSRTPRPSRSAAAGAGPSGAIAPGPVRWRPTPAPGQCAAGQPPTPEWSLRTKAAGVCPCGLAARTNRSVRLSGSLPDNHARQAVIAHCWPRYEFAWGEPSLKQINSDVSAMVCILQRQNYGVKPMAHTISNLRPVCGASCSQPL